ncbi:hypothetical protein YPPY52_4853, partial [Yersinia pestis PY-52]
MALADASAAGA